MSSVEKSVKQMKICAYGFILFAHSWAQTAGCYTAVFLFCFILFLFCVFFFFFSSCFFSFKFRDLKTLGMEKKPSITTAYI